MLAIQLKKPSFTCNYLVPLEQYIKKEYGQEVQSDEIKSAMEELRTNSYQVHVPSELSTKVLCDYFYQLENMDYRLPISETELKLPFSWFDSFSIKQKVTNYTAKFEQAAIMFNLGALESQHGVGMDRNTVDGLKLACKNFMNAAGIFQFVGNEICSKITSQLTPDMSNDGIYFLVQLMLAQAQSCFYEKSVKDKMKDGIKAKLANQAVVFYKTALNYAKGNVLKEALDKSWWLHVEFQVFTLQAATQYWMGKADNAVALSKGSGYGTEIARYRYAKDLCEKGIDLVSKNKMNSSLATSVKQLQAVVQKALNVAEKDNNCIYMEVVPAINALPMVGTAAMVKPTMPNDLEQFKGIDIFNALIPDTLRATAASFQDTLSDMVRISSECVLEEDHKIRTELDQLGLPASIEADEEMTGLPTSIWDTISVIQRKGGVSYLKQRLLTNTETSNRVQEKLRVIESSLRNEESEDSACRSKYGTKWNATPSSELNTTFSKDVDRYHKLLSDARKSDKIVQTTLNETQSFRLLDQSRDDLDRQVPKASAKAGQVDKTALSNLLLELGNLIKNRETAQEKLSNACSMIDIVPLLIHAGDTPVENILQEEQYKLDSIKSEILNMKTEQQRLLQLVVQENDIYTKRRSSDTESLKRISFIHDLTSGCSAFEKLESDILQGRKFYDDFSYRVDQLKQTVIDHCTARQLQRRELELNFGQAQQVSTSQLRDDEALARRMASGMQLNNSQQAHHRQPSHQTTPSQYHPPQAPPYQANPQQGSTPAPEPAKASFTSRLNNWLGGSNSPSAPQSGAQHQYPAQQYQAYGPNLGTQGQPGAYSGYAAQPQAYGAPQQGYGAPQQGSHQQGYGAPQQGSHQEGYGAPQQGNHQQGYGASQRGNPPQGYGAPLFPTPQQYHPPQNYPGNYRGGV